MTPAFKSSISEWVSPWYLPPSEWLAKAILWMASLTGIITAAFHIKRRPDISVIVLAVGVSAWLAMRNIQNYVIILAVAFLAIPVFPSLKRHKVSWYLKPVLTAVAGAWMIALFLLVRDYQRDDGRLGFGIKAGLVPVDASGFLKKAGFHGNIVNVLQDGGYLIWDGYPLWRVFVDGRLDVYGEKQIENYRKIIEGNPGSLQVLDQLKADAAVLPMPPGIGALRDQLAADSTWSLVYFDDYYLVYLKRNEDNSPIVDRWAYRIINPLAAGYGLTRPADMGQFGIEAERALGANPNSSLANAACGYSLQQKGEFVRAAESYKKAITIRATLFDFYRYVASMYASGGAADSAIAWYSRAIKVRPRDAANYYELGMLYFRLGDMVAAEYYLNEAVARQPDSPARQMLERIRALKKPSP